MHVFFARPRAIQGNLLAKDLVLWDAEDGAQGASQEKRRLGRTPEGKGVVRKLPKLPSLLRTWFLLEFRLWH